MSNGARHGLGVVIGLVVTPIIAACLAYGTDQLRRVVSHGYGAFGRYHGKELWIGAAVIVLAAVLLGLVAGSRLSPLASLVPGAFYTLVGVLWAVDPLWMNRNTAADLPRDLALGYMSLGSLGIILMLGVLLVTASVAPSRWKARTPAGAAPGYAPPPAPMGPPPMHGAPAPMGAPQPPPAPGQSPPGWQGTSQQGGPQYGPPPAQPSAGNAPPPAAAPSAPPAAPGPAAKDEPKPSAGDGGPDGGSDGGSDGGGSDDDGPGEWTRVYGGDRPN